LAIAVGGFIFVGLLMAIAILQVHAGIASASGTCPANGSNDTWTGAAGDRLWTTAANWTNGVPGTSSPSTNDHPCIPGTATVDFTTGTTSITALEAGQATLVVSGGELEIGNADTSTLASLGFTGGTLSGDGTIEVGGSSTWSGGTLGDPTLPAAPVTTLDLRAGTLTVAQADSAMILDHSNLEIAGGATLSIGNAGSVTTTTITDEDGAKISNAGTVAFLGNTHMKNGRPGTFTSTGTVEMTGGAATTVNVPYVATAGTTRVTSGTLSFIDGSGGSTDTAPFTVGHNCSLRLSGTQSLGVGATITGTGSGTVALGAGQAPGPAITVADAMDVPGGVITDTNVTIDKPLGSSDTPLTVNAGQVTLEASSDLAYLQMNAGELVLDANTTVLASSVSAEVGDLRWIDGTIAGPATLDVEGAIVESNASSPTLGDPSLPGAPVTTFDLTSGGYMDAPLVVDGSSFQVSAGAEFRTYGGVVLENGGTFTNEGTVQITAGSAVMDGGDAGTFANAGTVESDIDEKPTGTIAVPYLSTAGVTEVMSGATLAITDNSAGSTDTAPFTIANGASLSFSGAQSLGSGATVTGSGSGTLDFASGTITVGDTVNVPGGVTSSADVTIHKSLGAANTPLTVTGGELVLDASCSLPTLSWAGGTIAGPGIVHVSGSSIWSGGTLGDPGIAGSPVPQLDVTAGTLSVSSTALLDHSYLHVEADAKMKLSSGATLNVEKGATIGNAGTLNLVGNATIANAGHAGLSKNTGTVETTGGSATSVIGVPYAGAGGSTIVQSGTLEFSGSTAGLTSASVSSGATLDLSATTSTLSGLTGAGTLLLDGGTMSISGTDSIGTFTQTGGNYEVTFTGVTPGTGFGQLGVSVSFSLDGTLTILDGSGFIPPHGNYTLIQGAARTGTFSTTSFVSDGNTYAVQYNDASVVLNVS